MTHVSPERLHVTTKELHAIAHFVNLSLAAMQLQSEPFVKDM